MHFVELQTYFRDKGDTCESALYGYLYFVMPVQVFLPPCTRGLVFIAAIVLRSGFFQTDEESCVPITVHIDRHLHRCQPFHTTVRRQIVYIHVRITIM